MPTKTRFYIVTLLFSSLLFSSFSTENRVPKYQIRTIVIDAGHGGHDVGCLGSSAQEKDVALAVSLKLGALIEKHFPEIKVIYTRKTDVFIELHERAAIANRNHADLFICIHCNSGPSAAFGSETYVMGLHKSADNLAVAKRENSSILLEKDYKTKYDGFDPNSPEANIIFSLYQNTFMNQSLQFASQLQEQFSESSGRFNRGVKQAGFLVLFRTAMPSVLIELGFLTNKSDEKFLAGEKGQDNMANSILSAFREYKSDTERKAGGGVAQNPKTDKRDNISGEVIIPSQANPTDSGNTNQLVIDSSKNNNTLVADTGKPTAMASSEMPANNVFYTIQVAAIPSGKNAEDARLNAIPDVRKIIGDDNVVRYYSGYFKNIDESRKSLMILKQKGFKDAFICAFSGAKRISVTEAGELLKRE